jgi:hypothetical protein
MNASVVSALPSDLGMSRSARRLLCAGTGLFAIALMTGLTLMLHYFYVTPFEICSATLSTMEVNEAWPWLLPLLATESLALTLMAFGLALLALRARTTRKGHES